MKKIIADRAEGIAEIIDRILNEPDDDIALVIPKASALGKSVRNFHLLKREADAAGKNIVIESVDETILAFAKQADIEASHPLWRSVRGVGGVSDIVPKEESSSKDESESDGKDEEEERPKAKKSTRGDKTPIKLKVQAEEETVEASITSDEDEGGDMARESARSNDSFNRFFKTPPGGHPRPGADDDEGRSKISSKVWWTIAGILIALGVVAYVLTAYFDHADISITFKQTPWSYQGNFVADRSISMIQASGTVVSIPAQIFTSNKNVTETFPASSVQNVSQKAQGNITIYNDYSAAPQELVATTRFETPSGQIFRITSNITVPGAQVTNGQITPSSISAPIVADQPGPAYNIGPVAKLTIPGFQNDSGRYQGFYGTITASTTGGYIGEKAVPTAADIAAAKASTTALLEAGLSSGFTATYPNNFQILDGATTYQVSKIIVNTSTDSNGNFSVFGQATMESIGFDESSTAPNSLASYLLGIAQSEQSSSVFSSLNLDYSDVQANFTTGRVSFAVTAQAELEPAFSASDFTSSILGKSIADARSSILALPQLADGQISVWPLWLTSIPSDASKVHVTTQ